MKDLSKIKRNVSKMVAMNAPESDIDSYIESEGTTIDEIKSFKDNTNNPKPSLPPSSPDQIKSNDSNSLEELVVRPLLRTGKTLVKGALSVPEILSRPVGTLMDIGAKELGYNNTNFGGSPSETLGNIIDKSTGGLTKPRNALERTVDTAGEFIASGLPTSGIQSIAQGGAKTIARALTPQTTKELASVGAAGLGSGTAKEIFPDSTAAEIAGGILGGSVPSALGSIKNIPSQTAESIGKGIAKLSPVKQNIVDAAKAEGIKIPPSAITDSRLAQFFESRVAQSGLSGKSYDKLMNKMNDDFLKRYDDILENVSKEKFNNTTSGGYTVQDAIKNKQEASQRLVRQKYGKLIDNYGSSEVTAQNTISYIDNVINKLRNTASESPGKNTVLSKMEEIKKNLTITPEDPNPYLLPTQKQRNSITIEKLLNTKNDLNEIINYEVQGGVKQFLKGVVSNINNDIRSSSSPIKEMFDSAEAMAKTNAKTFRNDLISSMIKGERPETLISKINSPSDVLKLEQALGTKGKGKEIVNKIKRLKIEEIINRKLIDSSQDSPSVKYGTFASTTSDDARNNALLKYLSGQENYKRIENLRTIAQGVSSGKKFFNFSKSGNVVQDLAVIYSGLKLGGIPALTPYILSKLITSESLMNGLTGAVKAQASNDASVRKAAIMTFINSLQKGEDNGN